MGHQFSIRYLCYVWLLCCYFLAKCCWKVKEWEDEDAVRFLYEGFNGSMEIKGLHLCCKSRWKEGRKEGRKLLWSWEGILAAKCLSEKCIVRCSKGRVFWLRKGTLLSSMNVWSWSFGERSVNFFRKCCPGMKWLTVGALFCIAIDIAKVEGDLELFLCEADWIYLIHIQLGTLSLKE